MRARKLYKGDILFSEGDLAEEIIFILTGTFTMNVDISDTIKLPDNYEKRLNSFNVPVVQYGEGSYFGDDDVLADIELDVNHNENEKIFRSVTAEANTDAEIMTIKKRHLQEQLQRFSEIGRYMVLIAKEKRKYQKKLIDNIYEKYKDPSFRKINYEGRMQEDLRYITEHMSTKRRLVKSKEIKRQNIEMARQIAE